MMLGDSAPLALDSLSLPATPGACLGSSTPSVLRLSPALDAAAHGLQCSLHVSQSFTPGAGFNDSRPNMQTSSAGLELVGVVTAADPALLRAGRPLMAESVENIRNVAATSTSAAGDYENDDEDMMAALSSSGASSARGSSTWDEAEVGRAQEQDDALVIFESTPFGAEALAGSDICSPHLLSTTLQCQAPLPEKPHRGTTEARRTFGHGKQQKPRCAVANFGLEPSSAGPPTHRNSPGAASSSYGSPLAPSVPKTAVTAKTTAEFGVQTDYPDNSPRNWHVSTTETTAIQVDAADVASAVATFSLLTPPRRDVDPQARTPPSKRDAFGTSRDEQDAAVRHMVVVTPHSCSRRVEVSGFASIRVGDSAQRRHYARELYLFYHALIMGSSSTSGGNSATPTSAAARGSADVRRALLESKLQAIPSALDAFAGREADMYRLLRHKYLAPDYRFRMFDGSAA
jgi:hypothetical protein